MQDDTYISPDVLETDAESLVKSFISQANEQGLDCSHSAFAVIPSSDLSDGLDTFFNQLSDGILTQLPEQYQSTEGDQEFIVKHDDTAVVNYCVVPQLIG